MNKTLLPEIFPKPWFHSLEKKNKCKAKDSGFNSDDFDNFPGKLYLNDLYSKVIAGVRLRQIRIDNGKCGRFSFSQKLAFYESL